VTGQEGGSSLGPRVCVWGGAGRVLSRMASTTHECVLPYACCMDLDGRRVVQAFSSELVQQQLPAAVHIRARLGCCFGGQRLL